MKIFRHQFREYYPTKAE